MSAGRRAIVWLAPDQLDLVREAIRAAELTLVAVGTPERGRAQPLAAGLGSGSVTPEARDDLRAALASADADVFWIVAPGGFGTGGGDDAAALLAAHARGVRVATIEPIPAGATDLADPAWASGPPRALDVPVFVPSWPAPSPPPEVVSELGGVRAASIEWWGAPSEGSLASRLFGAMDAVRRFLGDPESIDAAYVSAESGRGVHATPGESLRGLRGAMTANLRFPDGRGAAVAAGDHAARWSASLTLLGPGGRVRVADDWFEWLGPDGAVRDASPARHAGRRGKDASPPPSPGVAAIARSLGVVRAGGPPRDPAPVLAMCHAALLSARTGQPESPAMILRMAGAA